MAFCSPGPILFLFVACLLLRLGCLDFVPRLNDYGDYYGQEYYPIDGNRAQPIQDPHFFDFPPPSPSGQRPSFQPPDNSLPDLPGGQRHSPGIVPPSQTPPPPSPWPPPLPMPGGSEGSITPASGADQRINAGFNVASKVGWAFVAVVLVLQVVLGAYLAYQWREMNKFGMWMEKIPSVSPPPSPAGFAPYTVAR